MKIYLSPGGRVYFFRSVNASCIFIHFIFFIILFTTHSYGQYDEKDFIKYTVKEGLSDNTITCIEQDDRGFIWIGTEFGLNRYDGYQFEKYYQGSPEGFLTSSFIHKIRRFGNHRLAIITRNGLQVVNTDDFSIRQYLIPDSTSFITWLNYFRDAIEFHDGTIGASSASGFYVFDTSATLIYRHDAFVKEDIGNKRILYGRDILSLPGDDVFVYVHERGQAAYNIKQRTFHEVPSTEEQWKNFSQPSPSSWRSISQLSDHEYMFLSREDSLIYYDSDRLKRIAFRLPSYFKDALTWESKVFMGDDSTFFINSGYHGFYSFHFDRITGSIRFDSRLFLKDHKIICFYRDQADRMWIGTSNGVLKQRSQPAFTQVYHWPAEDISRIGYTDGFRYKNKLYLSRFSRDVGMVIINLATKKIEKKINFFGTNFYWDEIHSIQMYYPDTLWLGTNAGILWFDTKTEHYGKVNDLLSIGNMPRYAILSPAQENGYAWMCTHSEGNVARYHIRSRQFDLFSGQSNPPLPFLRVKHICTDAFGDTWIGGLSLARWNSRIHDFDTLMTEYGGPNKYDNDIVVIQADDKGSLWIHNAHNGLLQFKIKEEEWTHYGMKQGFPSEVFQSMSPVLGHTLWITTHNQLIQFDTESGEIEIYDHKDGVPDIKPVSRRMYADVTKNELYVFYQDEVLVLPVDFKRESKSESELLFQKVTANNMGSYFFPDQELKLTAKENNLTFHFTLIDFEERDQYSFAYRMNENDNWTSLGNQRVLNLTNVSPGSYRLEVSATGKSGEQKISAVAFSVAPPFWKTIWFTLICVIIASGIIYLIYRTRIARFRQKANLDKLLLQTEMKALHAQMNPHFIFNSLNSIREMILHNETREASRFLGDFAQLIRITLDQSRQSFISLRSTMDYLDRYIEMEKIRNTDFHFSIEADKSIDPDETIMPPMLIQPFIENAIWHGMNGEEKKINIHVQFKKKDEQLICIIEDDGIGINQALKMKNEKNSGHQSVSIANITKRIELLNRKHDLHNSLSIQDKTTLAGYSGTGTIVTITLPLEMTEE